MTVFVSRHGMTECPSCKAHIRVATKIAETACPFCNAELVEAIGRGNRLGALGRSGMLAGALLGLSVLPACDDNDPQPLYGAPAADIVQDAGNDQLPQPLYGAPAPDVVVQDTADDQLPQPLYGAPAPDIMQDSGPDAATDSQPAPMYGLPADIQVEAAADLGAQPEYGAPPEE